MAVNSAMALQFTNDGNYVAYIDLEGKLKIWDTSTNTLKHEFTPNLHLSQPCTCLHWIQTSNAESPWRKRKRSSNSNAVSSNNLLALGTANGSILLYSPTEANIHNTFKSDASSTAIECLTWAPHVGLISCGESTVLRWNLKDGTVKCKWKTSTGKENVTCALIIPGKKHLVTASRNIKLWDIETENLLCTYTGHTSDIDILQYVPSSNSTDGYLISSAKFERVISCWNLNCTTSDKSAVAAFLMEDIATNISVIVDENGSMNMTAVVKSGVMHVYQQTLNGKCNKPIKPKTTIQIASDTAQTRELISPIPILAAHMYENCSILIGYGAQYVVVFEKVQSSNFEKIQCLIRIDPRKIILKESIKSKVKTPSNEKVDYLTPNNVSVQTSAKRKSGSAKLEVPMEQRLENLVLNKPEGSGLVPKDDNVAHLLIQGLHSKDKQILQSIFLRKDEKLIKNTVIRLPVQVVTVLFKELTAIIQGATLTSKTAAVWLKYLIQYHASHLIANPELSEMVAPALGTIENRLNLFTPLSRLQGRLDLLVSQISQTKEDIDDIENTILLYQDQDSSSEESDEDLNLIEASESDDQWDENSSNVSNESDVEFIELSS